MRVIADRKPESKEEMRKSLKKLFEEKYTTPAANKDEKAQSADYFFKKLKF